jgi:glyoxylase-like metal-dependent hydrolase (beta-lactamase superfamily II)
MTTDTGMTRMEEEAVAPGFDVRQRGSVLGAAAGVTLVQTAIVNCFMVGLRDGEWVLVDAGIPGFVRRIAREARRRFGNRPPTCIVLTHGHTDHVGSLHGLLKRWDVPVYAHRLEMPYLTGEAKYPPPDPTVGGGIMPRTSPLFGRGPFDFRPNVRALPGDGSIPDMPGWRYIHTPGHTHGHISLFREEDRFLLAGDAFVTQKQESFFAVMTNYQEIHGPPMYFTSDWAAAQASVMALAALHPHVAATGHGLPMRGERLQRALDYLARNFWGVAVPRKGRYVNEPALADEHGVTHVPPKSFDPVPYLVAGVAAVGALAYAGMKRRR